LSYPGSCLDIRTGQVTIAGVTEALPHIFNVSLKDLFRIHLFVTAVAALLVCGCFTRDGLRTQVHRRPVDNLDSTIDSIVNDKNTWIDPAGLF
jgi:hypothetical protein